MTNSAAIEALKRLRDAALDEFCGEWDDYPAFDFAIKVLENQDNKRTISVNAEWIPVSERLPEEQEWIGTKEFGTTISEEVYVTFENPDGQRFARHLSFQNGKIPSYKQREIEVWHKGAVPIAWMPLPEPYKGGDIE